MITLLLLVMNQLTPWSLTVLAYPFDVNGRVLTEDEIALSDVLISVYENPSGALVRISNTDAYGYFGIYNLASGSYNLVFEKKGYETYTKTISSSGSWINLGDMKMSYALQLSTTILSRVTPPGKTLVLPFTLSNAGEEEQECRLNITSPEGWKVKVTDINGELVGLRLPAGVTTTLNLEITVPLNASGENDISLRVSGLTTIDLSLTIKIEEEIQVAELKAKYPSQSVQLGSTINYMITIENPSQTDELFDLSAPEIPAGWEIVFKAVEAQEIGAVLITANGIETIIAEVTPALNSIPGEYLISIEAISKSIQGNITLTAIVTGAYDVDIDISALFMEIDAGTTETVTINVTNTGYSPLTNLEILITSTPSNWIVETSPLKHPTLDPNESIEFQISIQVPAEAARGDYLINFRPSMDQISQNELVEQQIRVTANPEAALGIYGLALVMVALAAVFLILMKFRRR